MTLIIFRLSILAILRKIVNRPQCVLFPVHGTHSWKIWISQMLHWQCRIVMSYCDSKRNSVLSAPVYIFICNSRFCIWSDNFSFFRIIFTKWFTTHLSAHFSLKIFYRLIKAKKYVCLYVPRILLTFFSYLFQVVAMYFVTRRYPRVLNSMVRLVLTKRCTCADH